VVAGHAADRALEARGPADREELLGVRAVAALAAERFGDVELDVEPTVVGPPGSVAAPGVVGVGGVDGLEAGHLVLLGVVDGCPDGP
jgi:hypothetical protein